MVDNKEICEIQLIEKFDFPKWVADVLVAEKSLLYSKSEIVINWGRINISRHSMNIGQTKIREAHA